MGTEHHVQKTRSEDCLCQIVKDIDDSQRIIAERTSSFTRENVLTKMKMGHKFQQVDKDTVPFMLFGKDGRLFIGKGIAEHKHRDSLFTGMESPVFRVQHADNNCWAQLELLCPVTKNGEVLRSDVVNDKAESCFFPDKEITAFQRTGVCIVVNLAEFMGISCLPAVQVHARAEYQKDEKG
ncbi:CotY/CotZ family spore coat protein [Salsuginibacillus kocurii]|uniref:CotY/CotZ family spore coat protein n=1 Tax=Salsuginibacillus kocurii TaxID=427078 RepID=UPI0003708A47|nr:CotY/CotZ family spore coat protein [Salsuginibacillus kocurii]